MQEFVRFSGFLISEHPKDGEYKKWLEALRDGNRVIVQQFIPGGSTSLLSLPFDIWQFSQGVVQGESIVTRYDSNPWNRSEGWICYQNSDAASGKVFPARVLVYSQELFGKNNSECVWSDRPIYEPFYQNGCKHFYLVEHGPEFQEACKRLQKLYPHHKKEEVEAGVLFTCFSLDWDAIEIEVVAGRYLYTQRC